MVIARFSGGSVFLVLLFLVPMTGLGLNILYQHDLRDVGFWLFLVCEPVLLLYTSSLLSAVLFHRGRAMWLEKGQLIFVPYGLPASLTSYLYRIPVDDIAKVSIQKLYTGSFIRPRGIIIERKSQSFNRPYGEAPAQLYSEPVEMVYARLCHTLGIKPGQDAAPITP